jgi:iron(III) transport system substrate-binding protein
VPDLIKTAGRVAVVIAAAAALLALVGCGSSSNSNADKATGFDKVFASIKGVNGAERRARLLELVHKEGDQLSLYTSMSADSVPVVVGAFEDAFNVDVAVYRAGGETVVPRMLEEADAGFHGADVVRINGLGMTDLRDAGLLTDYASEYRRGLIKGSVADGWTADSYSTFVVSWNTKLLPPNERPTSWEDLADPRWRGRVAIEASDVDWYKALWDFWVKEEGKTPGEADKLFEAIGRNALVVHGHTLLGQLMSAGEIVVGPNYANRVDSLHAEGAPLSWRPPVEPLFPEPQGVGLVRGARHPAAAVLFYDWLLSDGQKALLEVDSEPARSSLAASPEAERRVIDVASLAPVQKKWTDRYDRLLRLGKEVKEG